ncbi:alpha/beta hydrolase, partial [Candidatus Sumerlaeota bacterium]|nr:alpha/beta hydrolase [Candidatus Sumerlaeota bacterium]
MQIQENGSVDFSTERDRASIAFLARLRIVKLTGVSLVWTLCIAAAFGQPQTWKSNGPPKPTPKPTPQPWEPHGRVMRVNVYRDIEYCRYGEKPLLLDLQLPVDVVGPIPAILWIHGGGWLGGDKKQGPILPFISNGFALVCINHRLSTEAKFPAQIEDCKAAVRWIREHAAQWDLDPDHIGVWGYSSGGQLAALLGTSGGETHLEGDCGDFRKSTRVQAVCVVAGPTDFLPWDEQLVQSGFRAKEDDPASPVSMLLGGPMQSNPELARRASPITYISHDDPPFLLIQGGMDDTVPAVQTMEFAEALARAGVPVSIHVEPKYTHVEVVRDDNLHWLEVQFFDKWLRGGR